MNLIKVNCAFCGKKFFRQTRRVNEARKFSWNQYCSKECQSQAQVRSIEVICANPNCHNKVSREQNQVKKSESRRFFCSRSCAVTVNNSSKQKIKRCPFCNKQFYGQRKYCSNLCLSNLLKSKPKIIKITKTQTINRIKEFYKKHGRIPVKREFHHYGAARVRFGTWNKAIESAGFESNPVLFAKKHIAKDGHLCDSFTEKIIDDWFYSKKIPHKRNTPYPENKSLTADFLVKNNFVEFFGLSGEVRRYDKLVKRKKKICEKYKLKLIEIYPKDLYPINKLDTIFKKFINN